MRPSDRYHKWIEWSDQDGAYLGRCPDVITGIHGSDPVRLYDELCTVVDEVLTELERSERNLPQPLTRPMREVA
ncbi:MAG: pilus assembly protein HicB [Gammaproteobacteria bacterium]|nr:pilus assembly protein HicB [Gammaproteobacteria bacterium]